MARKKRIGRPPKPVEDRRAVNFTFRSRPQMRDRLQAAAIESRRSISEEIEHRLDQSFTEDRLSAIFLGGADTAKALRLIALAMQRETARGDGKSWKDDPGKAEAVRAAVNTIITGVTGLPGLPQGEPNGEWIAGESEFTPRERGHKLGLLLLDEAPVTPNPDMKKEGLK